MFSQESLVPPGENFVPESQVLQQIIQELAPDVLGHAELYSQLKAYLFPGLLGQSPEKVELYQRLQAAAIPSANIELILTILEGAREFQEVFGTTQAREFDQHLQLRQQETLDGLPQDVLNNDEHSFSLTFAKRKINLQFT